MTDFGLSAVGTSKYFQSTQYARGTTCYRAPELLAENSGYTNKVDIFALGCILFELVNRKKAFSDDFSVRRFASLKSYPLWHASMGTGRESNDLKEVTLQMLDADPRKRPGADTLCQRFARNRDFRIGDFCMAVRDSELAVQVYKGTYGRYEVSALDWQRIGEACKVIRNYSDAITAFRSSIDGGNVDKSVYESLGVCLQELGDYQSAAEAYENSFAISDTIDYSLTNSLADCYLAIPEYDAAIRVLNEGVTRLAVPNWRLFLKLGDAFAAKGLYKSSIEAFERGLEIAPNNIYLSEGLLHIQQKAQGDFDEEPYDSFETQPLPEYVERLFNSEKKKRTSSRFREIFLKRT